MNITSTVKPIVPSALVNRSAGVVNAYANNNLDGGDLFDKELRGIAKKLSIQAAAAIHPHVATGVRSGWIAWQAIALWQEIRDNEPSWQTVIFKGGDLALETLSTVNDTLPPSTQIHSGWIDGTELLLKTTESLIDSAAA